MGAGVGEARPHVRLFQYLHHHVGVGVARVELPELRRQVFVERDVEGRVERILVQLLRDLRDAHPLELRVEAGGRLHQHRDLPVHREAAEGVAFHLLAQRLAHRGVAHLGGLHRLGLDEHLLPRRPAVEDVGELEGELEVVRLRVAQREERRPLLPHLAQNTEVLLPGLGLGDRLRDRIPADGPPAAPRQLDQPGHPLLAVAAELGARRKLDEAGVDRLQLLDQRVVLLDGRQAAGDGKTVAVPVRRHS